MPAVKKSNKCDEPKELGFTWSEKEHAYFFDHFVSAEALLKLLETAAFGEAGCGQNEYKMDALLVAEATKAVLREFKLLGRMLDHIRAPLPENED